MYLSNSACQIMYSSYCIVHAEEVKLFYQNYNQDSSCSVLKMFTKNVYPYQLIV